jgi:hypothetical protein
MVKTSVQIQKDKTDERYISGHITTADNGEEHNTP